MAQSKASNFEVLSLCINSTNRLTQRGEDVPSRSTWGQDQLLPVGLTVENSRNTSLTQIRLVSALKGGPLILRVTLAQG